MDLRRFVLILEQVVPMAVGRRLCLTQGGRFPIVPPFSEVGDLLCTSPGAPHPFILRPRRDSRLPVYQCVGVCYADEAARCDARRRHPKLETMELV